MRDRRTTVFKTVTFGRSVNLPSPLEAARSILVHADRRWRGESETLREGKAGEEMTGETRPGRIGKGIARGSRSPTLSLLFRLFPHVEGSAIGVGSQRAGIGLFPRFQGLAQPEGDQAGHHEDHGHAGQDDARVVEREGEEEAEAGREEPHAQRDAHPLVDGGGETPRAAHEGAASGQRRQAAHAPGRAPAALGPTVFPRAVAFQEAGFTARTGCGFRAAPRHRRLPRPHALLGPRADEIDQSADEENEPGEHHPPVRRVEEEPDVRSEFPAQNLGELAVGYRLDELAQMGAALGRTHPVQDGDGSRRRHRDPADRENPAHRQAYAGHEDHKEEEGGEEGENPAEVGSHLRR